MQRPIPSISASGRFGRIFFCFSWRRYSFFPPPTKRSALTSSFRIRQPARDLSRLAPAVLALFPVCQGRLLHVMELCPGTVDSQSAAQRAHRRIALLNPFPQQLRVSRITHLALIARSICAHRVQIRHVRSPLVCEYTLELLYLQLPCKFHHYVVQQLVVRQWPCRIYYHVAEYLAVYVAVQLFQQIRTAESRVHLKEHQGHFPFRSEERPTSQLRPHAFPYQTEVSCHLAEREQLLYPAQFALFESLIGELVKIELRKRNVWRYFRKISYF